MNHAEAGPKLTRGTAPQFVPAPVPHATEHREHHHYGREFHIHGADGQDAAARLIRKALTEEN